MDSLKLTEIQSYYNETNGLDDRLSNGNFPIEFFTEK